MPWFCHLPPVGEAQESEDGVSCRRSAEIGAVLDHLAFRPVPIGIVDPAEDAESCQRVVPTRNVEGMRRAGTQRPSRNGSSGTLTAISPFSGTFKVNAPFNPVPAKTPGKRRAKKRKDLPLVVFSPAEARTKPSGKAIHRRSRSKALPR